MPSIQLIWSGPGWFGTRRSMVQIHSPRPLLLKPTTYSGRKVPTTSWLCAKRSVVPMSSPNDLHFPLQIGVTWRDAATTFSSFCSPRSPNRTGFGMGSLKPRPTFSPHSSRYWTSSRRASVARAHVVVLMGVPTENAIQRFSFECNIVTIGSGGWDVQVALPRMSLISKAFAPDRIIGRDRCGRRLCFGVSWF